MSDEDDALRARLIERIGEPMGAGGPTVAPDPVNVPMIRHWVDALDDRNPVYLDEAAAAASRHGGLVAPPAMLQAWTMSRPRIAGIAERGGAPDEVDADSPIGILGAEGYPGIIATNSELEFTRYLRPGDVLTAAATLESVSERKATGLGEGYFVTWINTYTDQDGAEVGRQRFRVYKFRPGAGRPPERGPKPPADEPTGEELPPFELDVTATVIVAGAIASRDFMPAHHDRAFAQGQGAPDLFMNILTTNGYVARYVTDWAGPDAVLRSIAIRLGGPAVPGMPLRFTGRVAGERVEGDERAIDVAVRAENDLGAHATGTVTLTLTLPAT